MHIKHLIGARKGDIEDLPFEVAKQKVERGEAEDVYGQLGPVTHAAPVLQPAVVSTRVDAVSVAASRPATIAKKKPKG